MRDIRVSLAVIVALLMSIGIVMIYSSSGIYALEQLGQSTYFLTRHLSFLLIGFACMLVVMAIDYRHLQKFAKPLMILSFILLVLPAILTFFTSGSFLNLSPISCNIGNA